MKRLIACVSLVAAATTAAVPSTAPPKPAPKAPAAAAKTPAKATTTKKIVAKSAPKCRVAPADEYFGKLKMSILGIRNTIKDQGLKIDVDPSQAPATANAIALTEDAIHDWERKYRCDSWLPGTLLGLERFYLKIHTGDGVKHVHATYAWLRRDYPRSSVVQIARREDGQATVAPMAPAMASAPGGTPPADASPAPSASSQPTAPVPVLIPGQAPPTPFPGSPPRSVINAMSSPTPTPTPHR